MSRKLIAPKVLKHKVDDIIYNRIGTSVGAGTPKIKEYEGQKIWVIPIEADYPRIIRDQEKNIIKYKLLHIGKVGEILLDENGEPIKIPSRIELDRKIDEELTNVQNRISRLLLRTESNKYAKLVSIKHLANPITNIITDVVLLHEFEIPSLDTKLGTKIMNYANVLERLKFIMIEDNVIKESVYLQELFNKTDENIDLTLELVLTDMIENEYETFYNVNPLGPYIKIPSSYYDYAISAQDLITLSMDDLWNAYYSNYPGYTALQKFRFPDWLRVLSNKNIEILTKTNSGFQGNDSVFDIMVDEFQDNPVMSGIVI